MVFCLAAAWSAVTCRRGLTPGNTEQTNYWQRGWTEDGLGALDHAWKDAGWSGKFGSLLAAEKIGMS